VVAAFGDAGHAFPAIALARALRMRGAEVLVETWERWRDAVEAEDLEFTGAEEYTAFPPPAPDSSRGATAQDAARSLIPLFQEWKPDVVVSDILTLAPTLAAEVVGVPRATLIPHVYPVHDEGMPFFAVGAQPPRTPVGRALWRACLPVLTLGLRQGQKQLNEMRVGLGLPETALFHGGISRELALVATLPQLEYPRPWPSWVHATGPMEFEVDHADVAVPDGVDPLVVVAPSTAQDPEGELVAVALEALADEPVRVLATTNRPGEEVPKGPPNATVVEWLRYSQVMPLADLVICHGGHGTVCRALGAGAPVLCCPAVGDMAENAMRAAWAGAGLALPWRFTRPAPMRAVVRQLLDEGRFGARAQEIAIWARDHDGAARGAELVEHLGRRRQG
jgi:UDP:flavonoid glycosyltransferase YjiC (YdhE family)